MFSTDHRVPRARTGGPGFAVGVATLLFGVIVTFLLFVALLALML